MIVDPLDVVEGGDLVADRLKAQRRLITRTRQRLREMRGFYRYGGHVGVSVQGAVAKALTRGPGTQPVG